MTADRLLTQSDERLTQMLVARASRSARPDLVAEIVAAAQATPQRGRSIAWPAWPVLNGRMAIAALVVATTVLAAAFFLGSRPSVNPVPPTPSPTTTAGPSATPTAWAPLAEPGWRRAADIPGLVEGGLNVPLIAGVRNGQVWVLATMASSASEQEDPVQHVHSYDLASSRWTDRGPIVDAQGVARGQRQGVLAVIPDGNILLLGQRWVEPVPPRVVRLPERMAWAVSPDTLIAVTSAPPPEANAFVYPRGPVRAPDGRLHLLEAYGQQINTPVTLVTYDPATGQWVEPPAIPTQRIRPLLAVDPVGGLYVIGGGMAGRSVVRLDPVTGEWTSQPDLPNAQMVDGNRRGSAAAFGGDGRLYLFSITRTEDGGAETGAVHRLDADTGSWTELTVPGVALIPTDAITTPDGSIMVVGYEIDPEGSPASWLYTPEK